MAFDSRSADELSVLHFTSVDPPKAKRLSAKQLQSVTRIPVLVARIAIVIAVIGISVFVVALLSGRIVLPEAAFFIVVLVSASFIIYAIACRLLLKLYMRILPDVPADSETAQLVALQETYAKRAFAEERASQWRHSNAELVKELKKGGIILAIVLILLALGIKSELASKAVELLVGTHFR
ncbi:hypothetical protein S23_29250 [Bradyrhizobium cosmicum]|uniref:Uncharacterized protein n=1 Tax=Bradyrhizobium cosmicum TaxID=1404864 RepID=A0AAI8QC03_9BRAD|nr:hypothetical protein S23_29250 [Bradyrhizobium cosmicum]